MKISKSVSMLDFLYQIEYRINQIAKKDTNWDHSLWVNYWGCPRARWKLMLDDRPVKTYINTEFKKYLKLIASNPIMEHSYYYEGFKK